MARGSRALVGLLAEGNSKRNYERAALRSLYAALVSARSQHRGNSGRLARGKDLAAWQRAQANAFPRAELFVARCACARCVGCRPPVALSSVNRQLSGILVGLSNCRPAAD